MRNVYAYIPPEEFHGIRYDTYVQIHRWFKDVGGIDNDNNLFFPYYENIREGLKVTYGTVWEDLANTAGLSMDGHPFETNCEFVVDFSYAKLALMEKIRDDIANHRDYCVIVFRNGEGNERYRVMKDDIVGSRLLFFEVPVVDGKIGVKPNDALNGAIAAAFASPPDATYVSIALIKLMDMVCGYEKEIVRGRVCSPSHRFKRRDAMPPDDDEGPNW